MAKKTENSSAAVSTFERYYKSIAKDPVEIVFGEGAAKMTVQVKPLLDIGTFASVVDSVANTCFDEDGKYIAWVRDVAFMHSVIAAYTNLSLPTNFKKEFDLLMGTDVYHKVVDVVNKYQFAMLRKAVADKINATTGENNCSRKQELDRVLAMLNLITQMCQQFGTIFTEITGSDMQAIMEKLQSGAQDISREVATIKDDLGVNGSTPEGTPVSPIF